MVKIKGKLAIFKYIYKAIKKLLSYTTVFISESSVVVVKQ